MYSYKLDKRVYLLFILFVVMISTCILGIVTIITQGYLNHEEAMSYGEQVAFFIVIWVAFIEWTIALVLFIIRIKKGYLLTIDQEGIKDVFFFTPVFAFAYIGNVKKIPYSSITSTKFENNVFTLTVDKKAIDCNWLAKLILKEELTIKARNEEEQARLKALFIKDPVEILE